MNLLERLKTQRELSASEGGLTQSDIGGVVPRHAPLAMQKFNPAPMVAKTPEEALEMLPDSVRAKAKERLAFCKMVFELVKTKGMSEQRACEDVAMVRAGDFPELTEAGKNGSSTLTYRNYREWIRRFDRDTAGRIIFDVSKVADNYARGLRGHRSGHPRFWQLFDSFYLNENRLPATQARCLAIDRLSREIPDASVATIHQVQYHIDQIPLPQLILARYGEEAFKNQCMDYMTRDWNGYFAGEALVADSREVAEDLANKIESGKSYE